MPRLTFVDLLSQVDKVQGLTYLRAHLARVLPLGSVEVVVGVEAGQAALSTHSAHLDGRLLGRN